MDNTTPTTNTNSITRYDFGDKDFKYNIIYSKISNLIKDKKIGPRDNLSKLIF